VIFENLQKLKKFITMAWEKIPKNLFRQLPRSFLISNNAENRLRLGVIIFVLKARFRGGKKDPTK